MTGMSTYKRDTRQTRTDIIECITSGLVPMVKASPGTGKSSIIKSIAREYNLQMIDHRLSTSAPEDLSGLPHFNKEGFAEFVPFRMFPTENTPIPEGKEGWMLFLDEFNSAPKSVQAAAYKLVLDKEVGQHKLHEKVVIVAAGNLTTDRAIVNQLSTAMQSRLIHINMEVIFNHWLEDVAYKYDYDPRIIAYLSWKEGDLMDFRPDHSEETFCCPRTWEFMNALVKNKEVNQQRAGLFAGTITSGVAMSFVEFTRVFNSIPKFEDIINNPQNVPVPTDSATKFAVVTSLQGKVSEKTFEKVATYINRFSAEFRVLFFRGLMIRKPELRAHPAFRSAMLELSRYLHDDA